MKQSSSQRLLGGLLVGAALVVAVLAFVLQGNDADSLPPPDLNAFEAEGDTLVDGDTLLNAEPVPGFTATGGQQAPGFTLPTADGGTFTLAEHRGKVIVLNFWATWCVPCRQEIPEFTDLQTEMGGEGVQFVGVSLDQEGFEVIRPYAKEVGINYPLVVDDGKLADAYGGVYALPTTFIIDRQGLVQRKIPGMATRSVLMPILSALLVDEPGT